VPLGQLFIRNFITKHQSLSDAGLWEGVNRISTMYLMVLTTSFSVYYLPRLSGLKTDEEVRKEVFYVYKFMVPFLLVTLSLIFLCRTIIIHILFNERFLGMQDLFLYQLIGDFFKMGFWVLSFIFLARTMTKYYIAMEFVGTGLNVLVCWYFTSRFGALGATMGFALSNCIVFIIHLVIFRKLLLSHAQ
jgi:PST family polysaccharide transporter